MDSLNQTIAELRSATRIAILSHVLPDGDCIGSMLALGRALELLGKQVVLVNSDTVPEYLAFLPRSEQIVLPAAVKNWPSLVVCVDCSDPGRLGEELAELVAHKRVINIDHHVSNTRFGLINHVDCNAAATGQMVAAIIEVLGIPWDMELATLIYTALVTDTGSFQYSNTSVEVHGLAAKLIGTGIDVPSINQKIYETKSLAAIKLLGSALCNLEVSSDGKLAWIVITQSALQQSGAKDEHTEGIINFTRSINTVEVGMLFREIAPGQVKVGFRSKQSVDVNRLAGVFGGGGHYRASGCLIAGELPDVVQRVIAEAQEFVEGRNERNH